MCSYGVMCGWSKGLFRAVLGIQHTAVLQEKYRPVGSSLVIKKTTFKIVEGKI